MTPFVFLLAEETAAPLGPLEQVARLPLAWAVLLGTLSLFLLLPRGRTKLRWLGVLLGLVTVGLFGWYCVSLGDWVQDLVFYVLAGVTVIAAAATISAHSPVYSAVWFALVLLGTAGLFLYQGAQFLGVATVVVYAGAILVTFLFVLMLAQPDGDAYFDRMSWRPLASSACAAVLLGLLTGAILQTTSPANLPSAEDEGDLSGIRVVDSLPITGSTQQALTASGGVLTKDHVATLGQEMFSRRLIAVEVAGLLLLAALVGAVAIVAQGKALPQVDPHAQSHGSSAHV